MVTCIKNVIESLNIYLNNYSSFNIRLYAQILLKLIQFRSNNVLTIHNKSSNKVPHTLEGFQIYNYVVYRYSIDNLKKLK